MKLPLLGILLLLLSCGGPSKQPDFLKNSQTIHLEEESVSLQVPKSFKVSSLYRLKEDIPKLKEDSSFFDLYEEHTQLMNFEDAEIDILVDTAHSFRMVSILNVELLPFGYNDAAVLNTLLKGVFDAKVKMYPHIVFERFKSTFRQNAKLKVMKFKEMGTNIESGDVLFTTVYIVSSQKQSFVIYEFSTTEDEIDNYLWSLKD